MSLHTIYPQTSHQTVHTAYHFNIPIVTGYDSAYCILIVAESGRVQQSVLYATPGCELVSTPIAHAPQLSALLMVKCEGGPSKLNVLTCFAMAAVSSSAVRLMSSIAG